MSFVSDWRQAWRWLSIHALAITGLLPTIWLELPEDWRAAVPPSWLAVTAVVTAVIGIAGRLIEPVTRTMRPEGRSDGE